MRPPSLVNWMRSSTGKMLMLQRQRIHASDETGIERRDETPNNEKGGIREY